MHSTQTIEEQPNKKKVVSRRKWKKEKDLYPRS
jgi:hypothetical protein